MSTPIKEVMRCEVCHKKARTRSEKEAMKKVGLCRKCNRIRPTEIDLMNAFADDSWADSTGQTCEWEESSYGFERKLIPGAPRGYFDSDARL